MIYHLGQISSQPCLFNLARGAVIMVVPHLHAASELCRSEYQLTVTTSSAGSTGPPEDGTDDNDSTPTIFNMQEFMTTNQVLHAAKMASEFPGTRSLRLR